MPLDDRALRHIRLIGDGEDEMTGGGLPLPAIFGAVLGELLDNGPIGEDQLHKAIREAASWKETRILALWADKGGWDGFYDDILQQLHEALLITGGPDSEWYLADGFRVGHRYEVLPRVGVTVMPARERETQNQKARAKIALARLEAQVINDGLMTAEVKEWFGKGHIFFGWETGGEMGQPLNPVVTYDKIRPTPLSPGTGKNACLQYLYDKCGDWVTGPETYQAVLETGIKLASQGTAGQALDAAWRHGYAEKEQITGRRVKYRWTAGYFSEDDLQNIFRHEIKRAPDSRTEPRSHSRKP